MTGQDVPSPEMHSTQNGNFCEHNTMIVEINRNLPEGIERFTNWARWIDGQLSNVVILFNEFRSVDNPYKCAGKGKETDSRHVVTQPYSHMKGVFTFPK